MKETLLTGNNLSLTFFRGFSGLKYDHFKLVCNYYFSKKPRMIEKSIQGDRKELTKAVGQED
jgi:hypothetical protein